MGVSSNGWPVVVVRADLYDTSSILLPVAISVKERINVSQQCSDNLAPPLPAWADCTKIPPKYMNVKICTVRSLAKMCKLRYGTQEYHFVCE
jgi:hypothetical protein